MKKSIIVSILLMTAYLSFGVIFNVFSSWDALIENSPDIIVARCIETPDFAPPGIKSKPVLNIDGRTQSRVEVLAILKGNSNPGLAQMVSFYKPHQGELFLVFALHYMQETNSLYVATEDFRVIPLNSNFRTNDLDGKTLDEKIQLILKSRLKDLDNEIARDKEEKQRLEGGLKK